MSLELNKNLFKKISFRLTFIYAVLFVLSSFFILFFSYFLLQNSLVKRDQDLLHEKISKYSAIYTKSGLHGLQESVVEEKQSDSESQFLIHIESKAGVSLYLHLPEKMQHLSQAEVEQQLKALSRTKPISSFYLKSFEEGEADELDNYEVVNINLPDGSYIQVGKSTDDRDDLLERYLSIILIVSGLVLILGSFGGYVFSNRSLAPLRNLIQTMKRVYSGELNARVAVGASQDELFEISQLFNKMTEKIERLVLNMQETLDQVAHELKTPLTRLQASAELALLKKSSEAEYKSALADTIENTAEIVSFINTIMDISEAQAGVLKLNKEEIQSEKIISECIDLYSLAAEEKNISIQFNQLNSFSFQADRNRCKQVLFNLLDNAIKYSSQNSQIKIVTRIFQGEKQICVIDRGVGISDEDLARIWDRLFRAQGAKVEKGLGLGLSLVKSICKAHGWKIAAQSSPGLGSEFILSLGS